MDARESVVIHTEAARVCINRAVERERALGIAPVIETTLDDIFIEPDGLVWRFTQLWENGDLIESDLDWMF